MLDTNSKSFDMKILIPIIVMSILSCSGQNDKFKLFTETNRIAKIDKTSIYQCIGINNSCPVFKTVDGNEYFKYNYINNTFIKLINLKGDNLIYINDSLAVYTEKKDNCIEVIIERVRLAPKKFCVNERILCNVGSNSDFFVFQEAYNQELKYIQIKKDSIPKSLNINGFNPIVREDKLYFTKNTTSNTSVSIMDLYVTDLKSVRRVEKKILSQVYDEGLVVSCNNKYVIALTHTESGDSYAIYNFTIDKDYLFKDENLLIYYPIFLNDEQILFYNPIGLDYIIKEIPNSIR
jgi:hypothetical protein